MTRHQIETAAVAHFEKLLRQGKRTRAAMRVLTGKLCDFGMCPNTAYRAAQDCYDVAELNVLAEAA
ncbi:hypothetical protein ACQKQD_18275 [Methylobacterium sp. NPDC080182]|uniref:hypothetical protein n=1 Tax=Methylobacterium sp. NPDC080182 TaxID=3390590 RepID=UPI003CFE1C16